MVNISLMIEEEIKSVSAFISELNQNEHSHIGYCGKDSVEIANSMIEDITDIPYNKSFLTAYEHDELIGVLGFDADLEGNCAEIWGPFIKENKWDIVTSMWKEMSELIPDKISSISLFPNKKNNRVVKLANDLSFNKHSEQTILDFSRTRKSEIEDVSIVELSEVYFRDMIRLHDDNFPHTYISGKQIIDRRNEFRKVFIIENNNDLCGYIYVEAEPAYGEASIEFFAVKETERGKGIGRQLLLAALSWLFTINNIKSIRLCVNSNNQKAINLYKKVGFQHLHDLCFFTKEL
ncbi:GNAT family N-acetyltransferase [Alkalihalobacterium chitinilyticum]|uniref:GNAT family N-acetyltransferase n=1 Tax=Alkalihalobacterium chitinilyticum TaxID=2980103 RepID=A0ABT5VFX9_9BACI|nr:GNAT family N-acetyltransferase [Alkalihalobacterium chitinilyticum]MDE5414368.1 GNAT family N-acetyltransferase [Alkalihalobacterium chitinilyticum]